MNSQSLFSSISYSRQDPSISNNYQQINNSSFPSGSQLMNFFVSVMDQVIKKNITQKQMNDQLENSKVFDFKDKNSKQKQIQSSNDKIASIYVSNNRNTEQTYGFQQHQKLDSRDQILLHKFTFDLKLDFSKMTQERKKKMTMQNVQKEEQIDFDSGNYQIYSEQQQEEAYDYTSKKQNKEVIKPQPSKKQPKSLKFQQITAYRPLCEQIGKFLVTVVQNITSVSFKMLMNKQLTDNECKDYASKNILINVHSLYKEIVSNTILQKIIELYELDDFQRELTIYIDETLKIILQNIIAYYPQAPPTGATPKMKEILLTIDRNQNQDLDLLITKNIFLVQQKHGDYTQFIMKIMNQAIKVTTSTTQDDPLQQTLFEKYITFNQSLFWLTKQESFDINKSQLKAANDIQSRKNKIINYLRNDIEFSKNSQKQSSNISTLFDSSLEQHKISQIAQMKKNHDFLIGKKLSNEIKIFDQKSIRSKNFTISSSSMLRMLTKWAQNLQDIFQNPQIHTINRAYPFKTMTHEIIYISQDVKKHLFDSIVTKQKQLKLIKNQLLNRNFIFQGTFMKEDNSTKFSSVMKRYTQTRILTSKMNNLLINLMKQFISHLIRLLVQIGNLEDWVSIKINLVIFRLGDLMRSKVYCTQSSFIRLIKTLYLLDEEVEQKGRKQLMKIVKIKNKLDTKDSNILITYVFMGQVQCEFQMSVQRMEGKQQNYNNFNHYLYELTRGKFGVLAELAIIVNQQDPIIAANYGTQSTFKPKQKQKTDQLVLGKNIISKMFICKQCKQSKSPKVGFLNAISSQSQFICDECRIKSCKGNNLQLLDPNLRKNIEQNIKQNNLLQVDGISYEQLKQRIPYKQPILLFSINPGQTVKNCQLVGYIYSESILYVAPFSFQLMYPEILKNKISQNTLSFANITQFIGKSYKKLPNYSYLYLQLFDQDKITSILNEQKRMDITDISSSIYTYKQAIEQKIIKENVAVKIKNKSQIFLFNNEIQYKVFDDYIQENKNDSEIINNLGSIEFLTANSIKMIKMPQWIKKCQKLKILSIINIPISDISPLKNIDVLTQLSFIKNQIQSIAFKDFQNNWKRLKTLRIIENKLFEIKLCQLPELTILSIRKNQALTAIQLKKYPKLQRINIDNTAIENIQMINYPQLKQMSIQINVQLKSIKVGKCDKLSTFNSTGNQILNQLIFDKYQSIQNLTIQNTLLDQIAMMNRYFKLQTLKISNNSRITELSLDSLPELLSAQIIANSHLQKIILKKCDKLSTLKIINHENLTQIVMFTLPRLQCCNFQFNQIDKITLSNCPLLKQYIIKALGIQKFDLPQQYPIQKLQIESMQQMKELNLSYLPQLRQLKIIDIYQIKQLHITSYPKLNTLTIRQCPQLQTITIQNIQYLAVLYLYKLPKLTTIKIGKIKKLKKIYMNELPNLKVQPFDWQINDKSFQFFGKKSILQCFKQKQMKGQIKKLKIWNNNWNNLEQIEKWQ